jgi:GT2 family glycosyltransferase
MSAKVSVIIPTFDRAAMLGEAIESALAQEHSDLEVIVVDDGSTDDTAALVDDIARRDARVRYVHQARSGAAAARNTGIGQATGDFVAFLDSDDSWKPWHLVLLLAVLSRFPDAGLAWSDTDLVDAAGRVVAAGAIVQLLGTFRRFPLGRLFGSSVGLGQLGVALPSELLGRRAYAGDVFPAMVVGNLVLTSSTVIRRDRLEATGSFDPSFDVGEDYDFFLRACRVGPVAYADVADIRYRVGTADKLALPAASLHMATGYLRALDAMLARDDVPKDLSPALVASARAAGHAWVGEQELLAGGREAARRHLSASLRLRPRHGWTMLLLALTILPVGALRGLLGARRAVRRRLLAAH